MVKCKGCKEIIKGNPGIVLQKRTMWGYEDMDFHNLKCFLNYIFEKHRKKFEKKYL